MKRYALTRIASLFLLIVGLMGCASLPLDPGPDVSQLTNYPTGKNIAVIVVDRRGSEDAGHVGLIKSKVKSGAMTDALANQLIYGLHTEEQINSKRISDAKPDEIMKSGSTGFSGILRLEVTRIEATSLDILIPIKSEISANVIVFDQSGQFVVQKKFDVITPNGILPTTPTKEKEIIGSAIRELVRTVTTDPEVKRHL